MTRDKINVKTEQEGHMIYRKERVQVIADNLRKLSRVQQIDITVGD